MRLPRTGGAKRTYSPRSQGHGGCSSEAAAAALCLVVLHVDAMYDTYTAVFAGALRATKGRARGFGAWRTAMHSQQYRPLLAVHMPLVNPLHSMRPGN